MAVPGGLAGFVPVGKWAVFPTDPDTAPNAADDAIEYLANAFAETNSRWVVVAATDPEPYIACGMSALTLSHNPRIRLDDFGLSGKRMASLRHSVSAARRVGLRVVPFEPRFAAGIQAVSSAWLTGKRGGEMGFTLGRMDEWQSSGAECQVVVDGDDRVMGFTTWRTFDSGRGRVCDIMRRHPDAPNPTMDILLADGLVLHQSTGVEHVSLGPVPHLRYRLAEHVYPAMSLRRYKDKFAPVWEPLWLITESKWRRPRALLAVGKAYCPNGLIAAARRNRA